MEPSESADSLESRLKSLPLRRPSPAFGNRETLQASSQRASLRSAMPLRIKTAAWKARAAALLGLAASVALLWLAFAGPAGSLAAAQVIDKLRTARTLSFDSVITSKTDGKILSTNHTYHLVPGKTRTEMKSDDEYGFVVFDMPAGKVLMADAKRKLARVSPLRGQAGKDMAASTIEGLQKLSGEDSRSLGERTIDGAAAEGFEITSGNQVASVWADVATGNPVRIEFLQKNFPTGPVVEVWTNISLDAPLDATLFSVEPPPGYAAQPFLPLDFNATPADAAAEFLRIYAENMDGKFPSRLQDAIGLFFEKLKSKGELKPDSEIVMQASFYGAGMAAATMLGEQGKDWQYYPGRAPGEQGKILFWFHDKKRERYRAVYGDFHVATVEKADLPPVEDE